MKTACNCVLTAFIALWLSGYLAAQPLIPPVPPPSQTHAPPAAKEEPAKPIGELDDKMFPDGDAFDFGKVPRGVKVKHVFRIVNTSNVPLRIVSVRFS
ncbi:MAG: DUF1573 domain-containing protein [Planctomycetes bacterium]|nr:DUF1573 domain-containing protein [Planctomycetota bacterium]